MSRLGAVIVTVGFSLALSYAPAQAASTMTEAFLANVAANLAILDTSSRIARDHAGSPDVIAYAASEAEEAQQVATALLEAAPADHAIAMAEAGAPMLSGRSVAVVGMTGRVDVAPATAVLEAANARMPATADLATLKTLHGAAFDKMFFVMQLDALSQIESDYRTYIRQGDDPGIATMAHEQLPGLIRRLEALTRV
jgi:hypothetical protein